MPLQVCPADPEQPAGPPAQRRDGPPPTTHTPEQDRLPQGLQGLGDSEHHRFLEFQPAPGGPSAPSRPLRFEAPQKRGKQSTGLRLLIVRNLFDLSGKTALVTGATRGLGQAIAVGLAEAGANIVAASVSQPEVGSETQRLVERTGRSFTGIGCDFSVRSETYRLVHQLGERGIDVDILVNNAGTIRRIEAASHPDEAWDQVMEVNLTAPFVLSRELAGPMLERGEGKIIFIASVLSYQGGITVPGYASAKHAIIGLTKALANEWAGSGLNVNAIAPGYMDTDNTQDLRTDPERSRAILDRVPAGKWGDPSDLVGATVFLASDASQFVNGAVLAVDGGWLGR